LGRRPYNSQKTNGYLCRYFGAPVAFHAAARAKVQVHKERAFMDGLDNHFSLDRVASICWGNIAFNLEEINHLRHCSECESLVHGIFQEQRAHGKGGLRAARVNSVQQSAL
jgi:hypothetical protein